MILIQRNYYLIGALIIASLITAIASAEDRAGPGERVKQFPAPRMIEDLALTEDQVEQLKKIHEDKKDQFRAKREAIMERRKKLNEAMQGDTKESELRKLFQSLQDTQKEFMETRFEKVLSIRSILTPEQRKKFKGLARPHRKGKRPPQGQRPPRG